MVRRTAPGAAAIVLTALAACGSSTSTSTSTGPQVLDDRRIFAQSKPGIVQVYIDVKASVTVPAPVIDQNKLNGLVQQASQLVQSGQLPDDKNAIAAWAFQQILQDPLSYYVPGTDIRTINTETGGQGSGFVISPDGYILTNAHVANPNEDELKTQLAKDAVQQFVDADIQQFQQQAGGQATPDDIARLKDADIQYAVKNLSIGNLGKTVYVVSGVNGAGTDVVASGTVADVVASGTEFPGKDVSLIKISKANLPTVPLGDDTALTTGDHLAAIGYPAAATFLSGLSKTSQSEPTLTTGVVSAKKTTASGSPVIQTDAAISPGSSGGPAFNTQGQVIGLTTAGAVSNGQAVAGENFIVPISVAKEFLTRANVTPSVSKTTQLYVKGLDDADGQHYSAALQDFQQVNNLFPGLPYVQQQITAAQQAINQGKDRPVEAASSGSGGLSAPVIAAIAGAAVLLLLLVVALIVLSRRRRPAQPAGAGAGGSGQGRSMAGSTMPAFAPPPRPQQPSAQWSQPGQSPAPAQWSQPGAGAPPQAYGEPAPPAWPSQGQQPYPSAQPPYPPQAPPSPGQSWEAPPPEGQGQRPPDRGW